MGRPIGRPDTNDLIGEARRCEGTAELWEVYVQPRARTNLHRWVSRETFATAHGAETCWMQFRVRTTGKNTPSTKVFDSFFMRTVNAEKEKLNPKVTAQGWKMVLEEREGKYYVVLRMGEEVWVHTTATTDKNGMQARRTGLRMQANKYSNDDLVKWLRWKFVKESDDGKIKE